MTKLSAMSRTRPLIFQQPAVKDILLAQDGPPKPLNVPEIPDVSSVRLGASSLLYRTFSAPSRRPAI